MKKDFEVVSFDFPRMLAHLTGTQARAWHELDGPESGIGLDYFYKHRTRGEAYINVDQEHLTIRVHGESLFAGNPDEDEDLKQFISRS